MRRESTALVASLEAMLGTTRPGPSAAGREHDAESLGNVALPGRRSVFLAALAASLLFAVAYYFAEEAYACTCVKSSPEEQAQRADAVFFGTVTDVDSNPSPSPGGGPPLLGPVTFEVEESWKGVSVGEEVVVHGYGGGGDCGIPFQEGKQYLVYADREEGEAPFRTSTCAGTKTSSSAGADLDILGPAETTPKSNTEEENTEGPANRENTTSGTSDGGSSSASGQGKKELPRTGGVSLAVLGTGTLLVGGLLARRILR